MRLKRGNDAAPGERTARGGQRGCDLRWMMRVIVDHDHSTHLSNALKAALDSGERPETFRQLLHRGAKCEAGADGAERVQHVVLASDTEPHGAKRLVVVYDVERRTIGPQLHVAR